ncbi:hypothetical protein CBOM_07641 [Ceraceosorus bombacis]|uniref:Uncharacterized protein n=1 Tax=Ceraceosorus bombacis TaxID=401625 RepID=A0A0P1BKH5_9BASI|nr:hypothetical protein CBOM_07641 [Ceraceosorus bombacis]
MRKQVCTLLTDLPHLLIEPPLRRPQETSSYAISIDKAERSAAAFIPPAISRTKHLNAALRPHLPAATHQTSWHQPPLHSTHALQ